MLGLLGTVVGIIHVRMVAAAVSDSVKVTVTMER